MSGVSNTAVGRNALNNNTGGNANTAIGQSSMATNGTGGGNTAVGDETLQFVLVVQVIQLLVSLR